MLTKFSWPTKKSHPFQLRFSRAFRELPTEEDQFENLQKNQSHGVNLTNEGVKKSSTHSLDYGGLKLINNKGTMFQENSFGEPGFMTIIQNTQIHKYSI